MSNGHVYGYISHRSCSFLLSAGQSSRNIEKPEQFSSLYTPILSNIRVQFCDMWQLLRSLHYRQPRLAIRVPRQVSHCVLLVAIMKKELLIRFFSESVFLRSISTCFLLFYYILLFFSLCFIFPPEMACVRFLSALYFCNIFYCSSLLCF